MRYFHEEVILKSDSLIDDLSFMTFLKSLLANQFDYLTQETMCSDFIKYCRFLNQQKLII